MTPEYEAYLNSDAWKAKRAQRLAISGHRCAACRAGRAVQVHHLTYARIFNEDMADLLPLCDPHHDTVEQLIKDGKLTRHGDVLHLQAETVRLLLEPPRVRAANPFPKKTSCGDDNFFRNKTQARIYHDPAIQALLRADMDRRTFRKKLKALIPRHKRAGMVVNALALWDRMRRDKWREQSKPNAAPLRVVKMTEAERHTAYLSKTQFA